ncbi:MAG: LPS assembly protein LptD, partial [Gammaproteobacteria bacterium]|nr:LPS assembly protein LptD [Gammaproteobacteria bacterium]
MVIKKAVRVKPFFGKRAEQKPNQKPQFAMSSLAQATAWAFAAQFCMITTAQSEEPVNFTFPEFKSCQAAPQPQVAHLKNPFVENPAIDNIIRAWSDKAYTEQNKAYLEGNVVIQQGQQLIQAEKLIADNQSKSYQTQGELTFSSPDVIVKAQGMAYQENTGSSQITDSQFFLYSNNGNGSAERIDIDNKQVLTLYNSDFSTCPEDQRSWAFESGKIIIDKESGWGEAYNSVVRVADIPVFYLPYITFPVDDRRKTGLLPPSFSNSSRNGADISAPYYLNLAPNYDLTLTPRYMSKRGAALGTEFRYLMPSYAGEIGFDYLPDDDLAADNSEIDAERWAYSVKHHNQFSENWSATIDAREVSDDAYFQDFGGGVNNSNTASLTQNLYLQYLTQDWHFKAQYQDWQLLNSANHRYKVAPKISATRFFSGDGYYANIRSEATRFEHKDPTSLKGANRYHIEPTIGWNFERLYGFIRPQLSYALTQYEQKDINGESQSFDRALPTASLDVGLFFER